MADFFFFTDVDLLDNQPLDQRFGPVDGFENSQYRLLSIHSSSTDANAYAICNGQVFVQQDESNVDLLNLVLRPSVQPKLGLPAIKYFIYKGIKKESLFNSDGITIASAGSNDLTQLIWDSQNGKNESKDKLNSNPPGTTTDTPSVNSIGVNYTSLASSPFTATDSEKLSIPFFNDASEFQLPTVSGGQKIGTFDNTQFALQIVFDSLIYTPKFNNARIFDHVLEIPSLVGGENQSEIFDHWHKKEEILFYMDASAFFGSFYGSDLRIKNSTDGSFTKISGDDIYELLLIKFSNRNRVYLDLRGELNHSFCYFGNYGDEIMASFDGTTPVTLVDVRRANWPILLLDSDFPAGNTSSHNVLKLCFPRGDVEYPLLAIKTGITRASFPENVKPDNVFFRMVHDSVSTFNLNVLELWTPNFQDTDTTPISGYFHLKYLRSLILSPTVTPGNTQFIQSFGMDHVFYPFEMDIDGEQGNGHTYIRVFGDEQFMDVATDSVQSFLANRGVGFDSDGGRTFFAFPTDKHFKTKIKTKGISFCGGTYEDGRSTMSIIADFLNATYSKRTYTISGNSVSFDILEGNFLSTSDVVPSFNQFNPNEICFFRLTEEEYSDLESLKDDPANNFLSDYPISIAFKLVESGTTPVYYESFIYEQYKIVLCGFKLDTTINEIVTNTVESEVIVNRLFIPKQSYLINI